MANTFKLKIYSPTRIFLEEDAEMIELNTTEGEIGVLPGHIALTTLVAPGVLRIHQNGEIRKAALIDGFLQIGPTEVIILSEACEWPEEIDVHRAEEAKIRAERKLSGGEGDYTRMQRAEAALKRSLVRLSLAKK